MMSVMNAEPNKIRMVTVMKNIEGPLSMEPVLLASHRRMIFTGNNKSNVHPTQVRRIQRAMRPEPALTSATDNARRVQPTMSLPTPAERTTIPTVVSRSLSSVNIRHRTGNAVIE